MLFLSSMALGIAFAAPPGIVTAETVRRGLARGFWPAFQVQLGSLIGDATWAAIALAGGAVLVQSLPSRVLLSLAGSLILFYLAGNAFKEAKTGTLPGVARSVVQGDFAAGALLSLSNPYAVAFWLGVGSSAVFASVSQPGPVHFAIFFLAFMGGALLWSLFLSGVVAWGYRFINARFFRWVNLLCGLALGYFGLVLFWNVVQVLEIGD